MIPVLWTILDQKRRGLSTGDHEFYATDRRLDAAHVASRATQLQPGREFSVHAVYTIDPDDIVLADALERLADIQTACEQFYPREGVGGVVKTIYAILDRPAATNDGGAS
jgi:hypothetical protein